MQERVRNIKDRGTIGADLFGIQAVGWGSDRKDKPMQLGANIFYVINAPRALLTALPQTPSWIYCRWMH
jgi:hypothetical protein